MEIYCNGQDIRRVVVGRLMMQQGRRVFAEAPLTVVTGPEGYLRALDDALRAWGSTWEEVTGIATVVGTGSPTALRMMCAIVNTLAVARNIPLFALQKDPDAPEETALATWDNAPSRTALFPRYDRAPV